MHRSTFECFIVTLMHTPLHTSNQDVAQLRSLTAGSLAPDSIVGDVESKHGPESCICPCPRTLYN